MDTKKRREDLARLKSLVIKEFAADNGVCNIDSLFIVHRSKGEVSMEQIYEFNLRNSSVVFNEFEIIFEDKGLFFGSKKRAAALQATFDGRVEITGYRHVLEYMWKNTEDYALTVPQIAAAIENIV